MNLPLMHLTWLCIILLCPPCGYSVEKNDTKRGEQVPQLIAAASKVHPRLFYNSQDKEIVLKKIAGDDTYKKIWTIVRDEADSITKEPVLERKQTGKRLLAVSRDCVRKMIFLSVAHLLTGDATYVATAKRNMLAVAGFSDWNPSHFLDVGEMTCGMAIGYDHFYSELDESSRHSIRDAIMTLGLRSSIPGGWWVDATNNWSQVCHGGLILGALAIMDDHPELAATIIQRAVVKIPLALALYAPNGAYPEGPGYWNYGTSYTGLLVTALEHVLGTDFGLTAAPGFLESATFSLHAHGPSGVTFNYADGGSFKDFSPLMFWFAKRTHNPSLLWDQITRLDEESLSKIGVKADEKQKKSNFLLPLTLVWGSDHVTQKIPDTLSWKGEGITPVGIHRSDWSKDATYLGLKAGSPGASHAHMDTGSFIMEADSVRWAIDLGNQDYNSLETKNVNIWDMRQQGQRWDVFRWNNFSHNTLVVDGQKQLVAGSAPIMRFSDKPERAFTIIDMSRVYAGQVASALRGAALLADKSVWIEDQLTAPADHDVHVRWGMVTKAQISIRDDGQLLLEQDGKRLGLRMISPAMVATCHILDLEKTPQPYDEPNLNTHMITYTVTIKAGEKLRIAVELVPGGPRYEKSLGLPPLDSW